MKDVPWKKISKNIRKNIHSNCSYLAMFPPNLPCYFIQTYTQEGDIVLDPFSGRGTTVTESVYLNRKAIGSDLNPLALILSKAKVDVPSKTHIIKRLKQLEEKFKSTPMISITSQEDKIKMIFHCRTLRQLIFLQENLNWKKSKADNYITAMILGILHGGSKSYLSVQMPNTFSMSPNYIDRYIKKHKLVKEYRDVFARLHQKLDRCYDRPKIQGKGI